MFSHQSLKSRKVPCPASRSHNYSYRNSFCIVPKGSILCPHFSRTFAPSFAGSLAGAGVYVADHSGCTRILCVTAHTHAENALMHAAQLWSDPVPEFADFGPQPSCASEARWAANPGGRGFDSRRSRQSFPLLLTLLGACEFLDDLTALPGFELFACIFHEFGEPASQFVNTLRLPSLNRLGWNQFRADPDGGRT